MSSSPVKTLGQVAYEAYAAHTNWKSLASGAALPQWDETKPEIRAAWDASAVAIAAEFANRLARIFASFATSAL